VLKALLWDNDGVLVDTEPLFFQATQEALADVGVSLSLSQFKEFSLRKGQSCFLLAEERGHGPESIEAIRAARNLRYEDSLRAGVRVLDHIESCLQSLHGRWPMAIVTSSDLEHFDMVHEQTGLMRYFEFALTNKEYERHKPHPEPYLTAAARLGVEPAHCLVIEDSQRGLEAAHAAGMRCLAIPNALSASSNFSLADAVLEHAGEIPVAIEDLLGST
jgi:HAD superfamily hydrolase (TIGR01509 family)